MTEQPDDHQLWAALVAAEQEHAQRRAEFYQLARSRTDVLARVLAGGVGDQGVALDFLRVLPEDVPALVGHLLELSLSHRWALAARQAIAPAWQSGRLPELPHRVIARLDHADDDEYRRLAELLVHVQAWDTLHELIERAGNSVDPHTREVAEDFANRYGRLRAGPGNDTQTCETS